MQIGFENPDESTYYESIGRINLYDLDMLSNEDQNAFSNYFNTLPMAVLEVRGVDVRTNPSYRDFMKRVFDIQLTDDAVGDANRAAGVGAVFMRALRQCCQDGRRAFIDEKLPDNTSIHAFVRRIAVNPVTGTVAVATAVLSVMDAEQGTTYAHIARALAADYYNLFYVDLETEKFIEYTTQGTGENLAMERHDEDFFRASRKDALRFLYPDDRETFIAAFTKENVISALNAQGTFTITCRLLNEGGPVYVNMKAMRVDQNGRYIIIGISNIDAQMKQKEALIKIRQEQIAYTRITALAGDYICLYSVDLTTDHYVEYSATPDYRGLGLAKEGDNFFKQAQIEGPRTLCEEDLPLYQRLFTKENVLRDIRQQGLFVLKYRLMINGAPRQVSVRAALVQEADGEKLIIGVNSAADQGIGDTLAHEA